jgi:hypothetical protein
MRVTRRAFVFGAILLGVGGAALGRRYYRSLEERAELLVRVLCDRFIPGHDDVPGAVALGLDREIVEAFRAKRRSRLRLLLLTWDLSADGFLAMTDAEQLAFLRGELDAAGKRGASGKSATIDEVYAECTRRYLVHPSAWVAIDYRTPQPHGYPDYAEPVAG